MHHVVQLRSGRRVGNRDDPEILRISQLRAAAARTADAKQAPRLLAIAMGLDGPSRLVAAQAGGVERQTPRDFVHRSNADELIGLADRPRPGREPRLTEAQRCEAAGWVESHPDIKTDRVARWRWADLGDRIAANFHLDERSVGKLLTKRSFGRMSVRPLHPQSELEAQQAFTKTSPRWRAPQSCGSLPAGRSKSGFKMNPPCAIPKRFAPWNPWPIPPGLESQGTLTRIWPSAAAARGSGSLSAA